MSSVFSEAEGGIQLIWTAVTLAYAIANPGGEVVDSLGAVSVVCALYGAYSPEKLIPARLLTHENFATLNGLRVVVYALDRREGRR